MKKQEIYIKLTKIIISAVLALIVIMASFTYVKSVKNLLFLEADSHLKEIAVQSANRIEEKVYSKLEILNTLKSELYNFEGYSDEEKVEKLSNWCEGSSFSQMGYTDSIGVGLNSQGKHVNIFEKSYFKESMIRKSYISGVIKDFGNISGNFMLISVPIVKNGSAEGVLYGLFEVKDISDSINFSFFEGRGYEYILDTRGNIVVHPDMQYINKNVFYELAKYNSSVEVQKFKSGFLKNESGVGVYSTNKGKQYLAYVPVNIDNQEINLSAVTVVPYDVLFRQSQKVIYSTTSLILMLFVIFLVITIYILHGKKANERILNKAAYEDNLCNILNRNGLTKQAADFLQSSKYKLAAIYIDIDDFKIINSIFGYEFGDDVLIHVSGLLSAIFGKIALIGRIDSDNFGVLVAYGSQDEIFTAIEKVTAGVNNKYLLHKEIILSAGIYFIPDNDEEFDQILDKAHLANKSIKYFQKVPYAIYNEELTKNINEESWLVEEIKKAIDRESFEVYYQPQFELISEKIVGSEALIRWNHKERGFIGPMEFIPLAEKTQLIADIGRFVFEKVCMDISLWMKTGIPVLPVAVNLSRVELYQRDLVDFIKHTVAKYEIAYKFIQIEITETVAMNEYEDIKGVLSQINDLGILISIDDFGSGYSSLGCLQKFNVDTLKLDRSFLVNIENDNKGINILRGMVELSKGLGLKTICEGIETREQLEMLIEMNCRYGQGYIFARPMPKSDYEKFVVANLNK
ncbi:MAG: EAL domain-containing protein [Proteocatella sp.]